MDTSGGTAEFPDRLLGELSEKSVMELNRFSVGRNSEGTTTKTSGRTSGGPLTGISRGTSAVITGVTSGGTTTGTFGKNFYMNFRRNPLWNSIDFP